MPYSQVFIPDHEEFRKRHRTKNSIQYAGWISPKGEFHEGRGHYGILSEDIYPFASSNLYDKAFSEGYFRCVGSVGDVEVSFYIESGGDYVHQFEQFARLITHSQRAAIRAIYKHYEKLAKDAYANFTLEVAADGRDRSSREYRTECELDRLFAEIDAYRNLYPI